ALAASRTLVSELRAGVGGATHADMLLCPPYVYLRDVAQWIAGSAIKLGAQDVCDRVGSGAFTGEVSGAMLAEVGCSHVIVGHSERRALYGETDAVVAAKFQAAQAAGLTPILCVGETLGERESGATERVVRRQPDAVLGAAGVAGFARARVASRAGSGRGAGA